MFYTRFSLSLCEVYYSRYLLRGVDLCSIRDFSPILTWDVGRHGGSQAHISGSLFSTAASLTTRSVVYFLIQFLLKSRVLVCSEHVR